MTGPAHRRAGWDAWRAAAAHSWRATGRAMARICCSNGGSAGPG
jgi:hypothetical protein